MSKHKILYLLSSLVITCIFLSANIISLGAVDLPILDVNSAIVIDANSGSILFGENEHEQFGLASITKLMTVYVFAEEAQEQGIKLDDTYYISERAALLKTFDPDISGVWYYEGEPITVRELLNLALIYSDNGAAIQLAEIASGTEAKHVEKMNAQAKEWGMDETIFYNASGLTMLDYGDIIIEGTEVTDYNVSSSADIATMAMHIIQEYPQILDITSKTEYTHNAEILPSWNLMLDGSVFEYPGVIGLKTGSSDEAKYCFTGYYADDENQFITVVLGANDTNARFTETAKLLDYAKKVDTTELISADESFNIDINGDKEGVIALHPLSSLYTSTEEKVQIYLESIVFNESYFKEDVLVENIPSGSVICTLNFKILNDSQVGYSSGKTGYIQVPLVSDVDIEVVGTIGRYYQKIESFFKDLGNEMI